MNPSKALRLFRSYVGKQPSTSNKSKTKISDYQLGKKLGNGSFGTVYLAKKKGTSSVCAIKVLKKQSIYCSAMTESLTQETAVMRKLKGKPFVLQLLESFSNSEFAFMALELAEMGDLADLIAQRGPFTFSQTARFLVQISTGLHFLHTANIVYRDLKPGNVLLSASGGAKLADFGLSKDLGGPSGSTQTFCGTALYMAPEMVSGHVYNYTVDWYALGIMVHEMYTGNVPYNIEDTDNEYEFYQLITNGEIEVDPAIERPGRSFIRWLTHMKPSQRPQSISEVQTHPWLNDVPWNKIASAKDEPFFKLNKQELIEARTFDAGVINHSALYEVPEGTPDCYGDIFEGF